MAELTTVARPYAEAVFRLAKEARTVAAWSDALAVLAAVANDEGAAALAADPKFQAQQVKNLLVDILGSLANAEGKNFITVLLDNRRFNLLPKIAELFELLKAAEEGAVEAHIETAFIISLAQIDELTAILTKRFNRTVTAKVTVAPELIGGVRMTIGDDVIDASVRGKLASLSASLTS